MFKLEILNKGRQEGKRIVLNDELTIGSHESCTVRAQHERMHPYHARFYRSENGRYAVEVGDENAHIFVNGRDVLRSDLRHHDNLAVGPLKFRVIDESVRQATANRLEQLLEHLEDGDEDVYDFAKEDLFYLTSKDPVLAKRIAFQIPSKDRFIDQAQQFLSRLVHKSGMDEMKVEAFMTCTKELILNAHRHGHDYDETKVITVRYRDNGDSLTLVIEDQGDGFDHQSLLDQVRSLDAAAAARARYQSGGFGGLGFQMITRMADDLSYNEAGNVVTFTINKEFG